MRRLFLVFSVVLGMVAAPALAGYQTGFHRGIIDYRVYWGETCAEAGLLDYEPPNLCQYNGGAYGKGSYNNYCPAGQQAKKGTSSLIGQPAPVCEPIPCPSGQYRNGSGICVPEPTCDAPMQLDSATHTCKINCAQTKDVKVGSSSSVFSGPNNLCLSGCQFAPALSVCGSFGGSYSCSMNGPYTGTGTACSSSDTGSNNASTSDPTQTPQTSYQQATPLYTPPVQCLPGSVWSSTSNQCIPTNSYKETTTSSNGITTTTTTDCSSGTCTSTATATNSSGAQVGSWSGNAADQATWCEKHPLDPICASSMPSAQAMDAAHPCGGVGEPACNVKGLDFTNGDTTMADRNATASSFSNFLDSIKGQGGTGGGLLPELGLSNWTHTLTDFVPQSYECEPWKITVAGRDNYIDSCPIAAKVRAYGEYALAFMTVFMLWQMLTKKDDGEK